MTFWKTAGLTTALVAAGAVGAAFAPTAHAQVRAVKPRPAVAPPPAQQSGVVQFMRSGGSEIGVTIRDVSDEDAKGAKAVTRGAVITAVTEGGPAETAGFKPGDVVTDFDGERIRSARQLARVVEETPVGRRVEAAVVRDGQRTTLNVQTRAGRSGGVRLLGELAPQLRELERSFKLDMPSIPAPPVPPVGPAPPAPEVPDVWQFFGRSRTRLGIAVDDLSDQLAGYFGTKAGVLVSSVSDDSVAARAGLKAGDVITSFDNEPVTSASDLRGRIQRLDDGAEFTIGVMRDKKPTTLKGKVPPRAARVRTYIS